MENLFKLNTVIKNYILFKNMYRSIHLETIPNILLGGLIVFTGKKLWITNKLHDYTKKLWLGLG